MSNILFPSIWLGRLWALLFGKLAGLVSLYLFLCLEFVKRISSFLLHPTLNCPVSFPPCFPSFCFLFFFSIITSDLFFSPHFYFYFFYFLKKWETLSALNDFPKCIFCGNISEYMLLICIPAEAFRYFKYIVGYPGCLSAEHSCRSSPHHWSSKIIFWSAILQHWLVNSFRTSLGCFL